MGVALYAVQHEVHQAEAVGVGDKLGQRIAVLDRPPGRPVRKTTECAGLIVVPPMRGSDDAPGSGRGILHALAELRLGQADDAVDQGAQGELLTGIRLLFFCVILQEALVVVAQSFLARVEPVEIVDGGCQALQVGGLSQARLGIGQYAEDKLILRWLRLAVSAPFLGIAEHGRESGERPDDRGSGLNSASRARSILSCGELALVILRDPNGVSLCAFYVLISQQTQLHANR